MRQPICFLFLVVAVLGVGCRTVRLDDPAAAAYLHPIQTRTPLTFVIPDEVASLEYPMKSGTSRLSRTWFVPIGHALLDYADALLVPQFLGARRSAGDPGLGAVVMLSIADYSVSVTDHRVYVAVRADRRTPDGVWTFREFAGNSQPYKRRGKIRGAKAAIRSNTDHALRTALEDLARWLGEA